METRKVLNTRTAKPIPVTKDLNVKPLKLMGEKIKNGHGREMMDDEWIYVDWPNYGMKAMNTYRAMYCEKMYLSEITIQESIGEKKLMDDELKLFVDKVSDKLVFEKFGKWYRVYLYKKTRRTFGLKKVSLYKWVYSPNKMYDGIHAHNLSVDWRSAFYVL